MIIKFKIFISPHPQLNIDDHNPIMSTDLTLFDACGVLYNAGIRGCAKKECSYGRK